MTGRPAPLVLLGAGGTALEVIDLVDALNARGARYALVAALDDNRERWGSRIRDVPIPGGLATVKDFPDAHFVDTLGSTSSFRDRPAIIEALGVPDARFATLVHPLADVSPHASIGHGCLVFPFAVIASGARLGSHAIVLPHCVVHHGASLGDWTILASHVVLAGDATVGSCCYLGAGASVIQRARVGDRTLVGMGSVAIRDVPADATVVGIPARTIANGGA
jgi:sugar O-acyltransferase (sialic acid O-acetyltransferase NeuD family)